MVLLKCCYRLYRPVLSKSTPRSKMTSICVLVYIYVGGAQLVRGCGYKALGGDRNVHGLHEKDVLCAKETCNR